MKIKRLIALVGGPQTYVENVAKHMREIGAVQEYLNPKVLVKQAGAEVFGFKTPEEFFTSDFGHAPQILKEDDIRHFFSKLQAGIAAVAKYAGKVVYSPFEAEFYLSKIAKDQFGKTWEVRKIMDDFLYAKEGFYLIAPISVEEHQVLKDYVKSELISVYVGDVEEQEPIESQEFFLPFVKSKAKLKTQTESVLNQIKEKLKGEKTK